jgi:hypothetical protein
VNAVHAAIGWAIVIAFGVIWLWGMGVLIVRRGPGRWFWRLLAFVQVTVLLQGIAGATLLIMGRRISSLHYVYGVIFPVLVLMVAHVLAREQFSNRPWLPFAFASFFCLGLTMRALMTGLGYS